METTEKDWLFRKLVDFLRGNVRWKYVGSRELLPSFFSLFVELGLMNSIRYSGRKYSFVRPNLNFVFLKRNLANLESV